MVPAYFETLSSIPMTSNNKADRKNLPAPKGQRFAQSRAKFVAPRTETERTLASGLACVMKIERASVDDHFFHDLGAHSLLMARFGAEIRKRLNISTVSMQDIYLNPTIEKLAQHIDALPPEAAGEPEASREPLYIPSDFAYYGCGALQLAWGSAWGALGVWIFVQSIIWTYAAMPNLGATYLRVVGLAAGLMLLSCIVPIALKWLVIGRWKPEVIPVWSLRYFRFWAMRSIIRSAPLARFGGPTIQSLSPSARREDRCQGRDPRRRHAGLHRSRLHRRQHDRKEKYAPCQLQGGSEPDLHGTDRDQDRMSS